jgi:hypothetical protein
MQVRSGICISSISGREQEQDSDPPGEVQVLCGHEQAGGGRLDSNQAPFCQFDRVKLTSQSLMAGDDHSICPCAS